MDITDKEMEIAERNASPGRYDNMLPGRMSHEVERTATASTASTTSSQNSENAPGRQHMGVSRVSTQHDGERDHTAMSRINTARSQHSGTVGMSVRTRESRWTRHSSRRPLPAFGGGKPYPPPLPEREEYVVEFDGPDDPLHAQNWPMKKK